MTTRIPIADLVKHVRSELLAIHRGANGDGLLALTECEFEFALEAEREAGGGIKVWLLDLKGGGKKTESNTVRIKYGAAPGQSVVMAALDKATVAPAPKRQAAPKKKARS